MYNWPKMYKDKLGTAEEAAASIQPGEQLWFSNGPAEPWAFIQALIARKESLHDVVTNQLLPAHPGYFDETSSPHIHHNSLFTSAVNRNAVQQGWADFTPNHFHEVPRLIRDYWQVDVACASVSPMDEHGFFCLGLGPEYILEAILNAKRIILEVNPTIPRCFGDCHVHISVVSHLIENNEPPLELTPAPISELDKTIGGYVTEMINDGDTLQIGLGGEPNAICKALQSKKNLGIHTEMITEGIMELFYSGAINNSRKKFHPGKLVGTLAWGTKKLYEFMNNNPMIELHPVDYTNNPYNIGQNDNMVSINAAIEVDLLGQVCAESMGTKQWSGTGGQTDFFRGANISQGGKGFITIPSTAKNGTISRIVPTLSPGAVVTTSKNDIDHVVTEYGVAKLRGKSARQRALELIAISHPDFRKDLKKAAAKHHFI